MRRLALLVVVAALLFSSAGSTRADEDEALQRMGKRIQTLLDIVTDLRKEVASPRTRVAELETTREAAKEREEPRELDYSGLVRVPCSAHAVAAYAAVSREDVFDAQKQTLTFFHLEPDFVKKNEILTNLDDIFGRVLKREKPAGYVFTEADFYPKGTRPGLTAGVPSGKRAVRLDASDVPGLHGLEQFDRFDLVMTVTAEVEDDPVENAPAPTTPPARVERKRAEVRTIVNNGLVVQPATLRDQSATTSTLPGGANPTTTRVEEIVIAVDPDEVAALNLALAIRAPLQVAMRSGQGSEDVAAEGVIPAIGWVLVVEPKFIEESQLDDVPEPGTSPFLGGPERVPSEAAGVYVIDGRASIEATVAKAGAASPEEEAAIREVGEETFAHIEMTLELKLDGTFTARFDGGDDEEQTAAGTWSLVGETLTLVTTHEGGQERETPDDAVSGTWKGGRITMSQDGGAFVAVFVRQPR